MGLGVLKGGMYPKEGQSQESAQVSAGAARSWPVVPGMLVIVMLIV